MDSNEDLLIDEEGMESEEDLGQQNSAIYSEAVVWGTDWTAETIVSQLKKKNIDLAPDFQRRDAWDQEKKSKFIESLILGLPVPPIILAEQKDKKNSYLVIDGKQRLLSIMQFCSNEGETEFAPLYLKGLKILTTLNGKNYYKMHISDESFDQVNQFDNQTIRTTVIRNWPSESFLYTVFLRLNTGSLKLSPQELRQALLPGKFLSFIRVYAESDNPVWQVLRLKKPDSRMRDVELIIRYFAFKNFRTDYKDSLKEFMDETCNKLNQSWDNRSQAYIQQLKELGHAIDFVTQVFGQKERFSKYINGKYTSIFNRTIFDLMSVYFSDPVKRSHLATRQSDVKQAFEILMNDNEAFLLSVSGSTKDSAKITTRFQKFEEAMDRLFGA